MTETLTEKRIKAALTAGVSKRRVIWDADTTGFGLCLHPTGGASWVYRYRPKGARRGTAQSTLTIGKWPTVRIENARTAARIYAGKVAQGGDPAREIREQRLRPRHLLSQTLDQFESSLKRRRIVKISETMSRLRRGLAPHLTREVETLTRAMLVSCIEELEAEGKPGAANALRSTARTFLEWCVTKGLIAFNPLAGLRRPAASRAERLDSEERKGRALSDDEIRVVWLSAGNLNAFGGLVQLGMLTGMRRNELAGLTWADITGDRIVLAATGTKTGARHEVPSTPLMRSVIEAQPKTTANLVFPSPRRKLEAQLTGWNSLLARIVKASGVKFRLHDLRRTTRTLMSRLGVAEFVAEAAIGHSKTGLIAVYDKHDHWDDRVIAFEKVSAHIATLVDTANVVALPRRQTARPLRNDTRVDA